MWRGLFSLIYAIFICIIGGLILLTLSSFITALQSTARADDAGLIELEQVYVNFKQYSQDTREPLLELNGPPGSHADKGLELHLDTNFYRYFYWHNVVHGTTDQWGFRTVGWFFTAGVRLTDSLELQYEHHSQHVLDYQGPNPFPLEDSIGINLYLYRGKPTNKDSVF